MIKIIQKCDGSVYFYTYGFFNHGKFTFFFLLSMRHFFLDRYSSLLCTLYQQLAQLNEKLSEGRGRKSLSRCKKKHLFDYKIEFIDPIRIRITWGVDSKSFNWSWSNLETICMSDTFRCYRKSKTISGWRKVRKKLDGIYQFC